MYPKKFELGELLTLYPITRIDEISKEVPRPASGLPINSLPGWDRIPLCNKLPMLDTPTNEIIFSREKMGRKLWKPSEFVLYDPNCYTVKLNYDPLHDPHLKNFYSRPVNFKRIKEIGRVTDDKDVICTLKDFNDYRLYIRRLHLDLVNNEVRRREMEQQDRFLLQIAEDVAYKQAEKMRNSITRTKSEIFRLKQARDRSKREKALQAVNHSRRIVEKIEKIKENQKMALQEHSRMHNLEITYRIKRAQDTEKLRVITLKKKLQLQDMRLQKFLKNRFQDERELKLLKATADWQRQVEYRAWRHKRNRELRLQALLLRKQSVQKHKQLTQMRWDRIQMQIAEKSYLRHRKDMMYEMTHKMHRILNKKKYKRRKLNKALRGERPTESQFDHVPPRRSSIMQRKKSASASFALTKHAYEDIQDAISTAISIHKEPVTNHLSTEKILSSAKYILQKVLKNVNRNLGEDFQAREYMYRRIEELFLRVKKHVLLKVERVLQAAEDGVSRRSSELGVTKSCPFLSSFMLPLWSRSLPKAMSKTVSFGEIEPIGKTAQQIDSSIELRSVRSRTPTPASSFTSVNAVVKEACSAQDVQVPIKSHEGSFKIPNWTANERIFVEHFYIKFKKTLLVGVERAVFDAIDLKKREFRLHAKREILEMDRQYLTNIMAESILTYNLNSYNYYGNTRLCTSVLAAECLFDLQNSPLTPKHDPSYRIEPRCRCNIGTFGKTCRRNSGGCNFN